MLGPSRAIRYPVQMPELRSRLGTWHLDNVHAWSERTLEMRAPESIVIRPDTRVATIGSCFAEELAKMMAKVNVNGAMHPSGLFYSTASIRQELESLAGGWPERDDEPLWRTPGGLVDPFRSYDLGHPDEATLIASRVAADEAAAELFRGASVVVVTLGLIETWRSPQTGNTFRAIPHPAVFDELRPEFHRLTVAEMLEDLERIRRVIVDDLGATMIVTTSPVPLHTTFTPLDVRIANVESKSRIRAAVSEFVDRFPDVRYFHSYEMVVTAERQSDYFRDDGRHIERHAVRYIISEFLRLFADPALRLTDVDSSWLTPIEKTAAEPSKPTARRPPSKPPKPPAPMWRRAARRARRAFRRGAPRP